MGCSFNIFGLINANKVSKCALLNYFPSSVMKFNNLKIMISVRWGLLFVQCSDNGLTINVVFVIPGISLTTESESSCRTRSVHLKVCEICKENFELIYNSNYKIIQVLLKSFKKVKWSIIRELE